jgi:hypothetical protein
MRRHEHTGPSWRTTGPDASDDAPTGPTTGAGIVPAAAPLADLPGRRPAAIALGVVGVALYNWWVVVAFHTHLLSTPDELFSDLEAAGRPDAAALQHLDLFAGVVLATALVVRGRRGPQGNRAEWPWLLAFAVAGGLGGHFSYVCPEGLSASCRSAEWRLALPPHHYLHVLAGIAEFATATVAAYLAWQRTRAVERPTTRVVRWTGRALVAAYPLLAYAYLTDRLGAFVEPIFFVCFSVLVLVELVEPDRPTDAPRDVPTGRAASPDRSRRPLHWVSAIQHASAAGVATPGGPEAPDRTPRG